MNSRSRCVVLIVFLSLFLNSSAWSGDNEGITPMPTYVGSAKIILVNGLTCSGKSTLTKALVEELQNQGKKVVRFSLDEYLIEMATDPRLRGASSKLAQQLKLAPGDVDVWPFHERIILAAGDAGVDIVVVDHSIRNQTVQENFFYLWNFFRSIYTFKNYEIAMIKVFCSKEVALGRLNQRNLSEEKREHRDPGQLEAHFRPVAIEGLNSMLYDFDLKTEKVVSCLLQDLIGLLNNVSLKAASANYERLARILLEKYSVADSFNINLFNERR